MSAGGGINVITTAYTAENATNYSVASTASNILWLPVPKEALYKAKAAIDTTIFRAADTIAAMTVIIGTRFIEIGLKDFLKFNLGLIVIWLVIALLILRERRRWGTGSAKRGKRPENKSKISEGDTGRVAGAVKGVS